MIAIETRVLPDGTLSTTDGVSIHVPTRNRKEFNELVQRAVNLWPDASAEIKAFADIITCGKQLQPYKQLAAEKYRGMYQTD